jgi:hypothetical protein
MDASNIQLYCYIRGTTRVDIHRFIVYTINNDDGCVVQFINPPAVFFVLQYIRSINPSAPST